MEPARFHATIVLSLRVTVSVSVNREPPNPDDYFVTLEIAHA